MTTLTLHDGSAAFDVTRLEAVNPTRVVLFGVGRGGDPRRHLPLLTELAKRGCTVVAPHFEMLAPTPADEDLLLRARRLTLALATAESGAPLAGVGHSIGATLLLALAGGQLWTRAGTQLQIAACPRLDRLVLLAPAAGFVLAPGALDRVRAPVLAWAGSQDNVAPPAQLELVQQSMEERCPFDLRVVEGAGHFSFMDAPPPQTIEPLADRLNFLRDLADEVARFVTS